MPRKLHLKMSSVYVMCWIFLHSFQTYFCIKANSVDPDQTAPRWAVWSGSTLFAKKTFKIRSRLESRWQLFTLNILTYLLPTMAGLGGSFGCTVRLETRRSRVQPLPRSATFFLGDWSWNILYGHSLPSADSRKAVVSFWQKNVHNTG